MTFHDFLETKRNSLLNSQNRTILAIDSSTQLASIALCMGGQIIFNEECFRQKSHSEWINNAVERTMAQLPGGWDALDLIAVTHGPGSFTGLRVATNLVKTLAYAKDKPIVSYSSLEILANQAACIEEHPYILPAINAFKNMVFMALYKRESNGSLTNLVEPRAVDIDKLSEFVLSQIQPSTPTKVQVIGDGYASYKSYLDPEVHPHWLRTEAPLDHPLASTLVKLVNQNWLGLQLHHWRELVPTYIRASAAEENKINS